MSTILVWLLVSVSYSIHNYGTVTTVERFATKEECERVKDLIPRQGNFAARCIQAQVAVIK